MRDAETIRWQKDARAKHHKERRKIYEQRRTRRGRVEEALKDQNEFGCKEYARQQAKPQRAVMLEHRNATQSAPHGNQQRRESRTHGGLRQRWNVVDREFGRNLVETPGQAKDDHNAGRKRIEWTRGRCVGWIGQRAYRLTRPCSGHKCRRFRSPVFSARTPPHVTHS